MNIAKVSYDGSTVEVEWRNANEAASLGAVFRSKMEPSTHFKAAVEGLLQFARKILEYPEKIQNLSVTGVAFSTDKDGIRGCVLTCRKLLRSSPASIAINTPRLAEWVEGAVEWKPGMYLEGMQEELDNLEARAEEYVASIQRLQGDLFAAPGVPVVDPPKVPQQVSTRSRGLVVNPRAVQ